MTHTRTIEISSKVFFFLFFFISQECMNLNNLFSLFSFLAGLNLTPVQRLKKTWAVSFPFSFFLFPFSFFLFPIFYTQFIFLQALPSQTRKLHDRLEKLSDPSRNMLAYRTFMANCTPPLIPFIRK